MKRKCSSIIGLLFIIMTIGNVSADPMKYTDMFDAGHKKLAFRDYVEWEFDITNDGFDPLSMDVKEASIEVAVEDDDRDIWIFNLEIAALLLGESQLILWEVDTDNYEFEVSSLLSLNEDGTMSALLGSVGGDFYLNSATLTAFATPEPAAVSLICFGLIGMIGLGYRRKMK